MHFYSAGLENFEMSFHNTIKWYILFCKCESTRYIYIQQTHNISSNQLSVILSQYPVFYYANAFIMIFVCDTM